MICGTQAVFHDFMVAPQTEHSKLAISRNGALLQAQKAVLDDDDEDEEAAN